MPRIKAATLPEHRDAQRARLLAAARELVLTEGPGGLRFAALAARAGVARPSVYDYFPTPGALLIALIDAEFPPWRAALEKAMARASSPREQVRLFVQAQLRMLAGRGHELPFALARGELAPEVQAHVAHAHRELFGLLHAALMAQGVKDSEAALTLISGALQSAAELLRKGARSEPLAHTTLAFVMGGLDALARPDP